MYDIAAQKVVTRDVSFWGRRTYECKKHGLSNQLVFSREVLIFPARNFHEPDVYDVRKTSLLSNSVYVDSVSVQEGSR